MFESGPYVHCYRATSRADGRFSGVRCIKFANLVHCPEFEGVAFVWYAEGVEAAGPYRHFGEAFVVAPGTSGSRSLIAQAAGLMGNGEREEPFLRLRFEVPSPAAEVPTRLIVTGDREEEWTLVPDGVVPDYPPLLRHIERAGPRVNTYRVSRIDGTPGFGIRVMLTSGSWLGAGRWLHRTYLNLGTYIGPRTGPVRFSASDIAAGNWFCGLVPWGELEVRADIEHGPAVLQVTGAWSETWELRQVATGWRPDEQIAHFTLPG